MRIFNFLKMSKRTLVVVLLITIISVGLGYGLYAYTNWTNREVYNSNESINFDDFKVRMIDYSYTENSGLPNKDVLIEGQAKNEEDCSRYPDTVSPGGRLFWGIPSPEKTKCYDTNGKIGVYKGYEPIHSRVALNIEITAKKDKSIKVSDIKTYLNVPSGRDITKKIEYPTEFSLYTPYGVSSKAGYLHSELSRKINLWADLRKEERLIDLVIIHKDQQRIYRLEF